MTSCGAKKGKMENNGDNELLFPLSCFLFSIQSDFDVHKNSQSQLIK